MTTDTQDVEIGESPDLQSILTFDALTLGNLGAHLMFGPVDDDSAKEAVEFIIKSNMLFSDTKLTFFINSYGGEVPCGFSIIDVMSTSRLPVRTVGIGMIASMALLILCAGTKGERLVTTNTEIMAHQFSQHIGGKHHELIAVQASYNRSEQQFIRHFKRHSKMTEKQIRDILFSPSDRYLEPKDLLRLGLVDKVVENFDTPFKKTSARRTTATKKR